MKKIKNLLLIILIAMISAVFVCDIVAFAETSTQDDAGQAGVTVALDSTTVEIASDNTYTISSAEELLNFKTIVEAGNTFEGSTVVLINDIDMYNADAWLSIQSVFKGTFDGQNYKIYDITYLYPKTNMYGISLFYKIEDATITNVQVTDIEYIRVKGDTSYHSYYYLSGLVGYSTNSTISNCYVQGEMLKLEQLSSTSAAPGRYNIGGVCAYATGSTITDCTNELKIDRSGGGTVGGVVATAYNSEVVRCYNNADVVGFQSGNNTVGFGGVVGSATNSNINYCKNSGLVATSGSDSSSVYTRPAGGIVGYFYAYSGDKTIANCMNNGYISARSSVVGGIAGRVNTKGTSSQQTKVVIFNCLNTGRVGGYNVDTGAGDSVDDMSVIRRSYAGGMVGYYECYSSSYDCLFINNCYNSGYTMTAIDQYWAPDYGLFVGQGETYTNPRIYHSYQVDTRDNNNIALWAGKSNGANDTKNIQDCFVVEDRIDATTASAHITSLNTGASEGVEYVFTSSSSVVNKTDVVIEDYAEWTISNANIDTECQVREGYPCLQFESGYQAPPTYTVTYTDGVEDAEIFTDVVIAGIMPDSTTPSYSGTPTRTDYLFKGWSPKVADTVTEDAIYVAQWVPAYCTVTYTDGVTGEEVFADQSYSVKNGESVTAFVGTPTRADYVFKGWSPSVEGAITDDTTFVAQWERTYTVKYTDGVAGDIIFADEVTSGILAGASTPAFGGSAVRDSYIFSGWSPTLAETVSADVVYVAQWEQTYTVKYTDGVADSVVFADVIKSGLLLNDTTPKYEGTPIREKYVFSGWSPEVANTVEKDVIYTAQWEETYTVTYTDGVASEIIFADEVTSEILAGASTPTFSGSTIRDKYVFSGWSPEFTSTVSEDVIYTAQWEETYTVTYTDGIDGTVIFADFVTNGLLQGDTTPSYSGTPTREHYVFSGWDADVLDAVAGNTVYTATWQAVQYSITYVLNGGINNVDNIDSYTIETATFSFKDASKMSCVFEGWFDSSTYDNQVTSVSKGSTGNITLYAKYSLSGLVANTLVAGAYQTVQEFELSHAVDGVQIYYTMTFGGHTSNAVAYSSDEIYYVSQDSTITAWAELNGEVSNTAVWQYTCLAENNFGIAGAEPNSPIIVGNPESISANFDIIQIPSITDDEKGVLKDNMPYGYEFAEGFHLYATVNGEIVLNPQFNGVVTVTLDKKLDTTKTYVLLHLNSSGTIQLFSEEEGTLTKGEEGDTLSFGFEVDELSPFMLVSSMDTYTVTYADGAYGTVFTSQVTAEIMEGTAMPTFKGSLVRAGYDFVGWDATVAEIVTTDVTYTARWVAVQYNIKYVLNGGTNASANIASYTVETPTINLGIAVKTSHRFDGWFDAQTGGNKVTAIASGSVGDIELYARFTYIAPPTITVVGQLATIKGNGLVSVTINGKEVQFTGDSVVVDLDEFGEGELTIYAEDKNELSSQETLNITIAPPEVSDNDAKPFPWWWILIAVIAVLLVSGGFGYYQYRRKR